MNTEKIRVKLEDPGLILDAVRFILNREVDFESRDFATIVIDRNGCIDNEPHLIRAFVKFVKWRIYPPSRSSEGYYNHCFGIDGIGLRLLR